MSAVGSTETHRALVTQSPDAIGFAAFDAGLVEIDRGSGPEPRFIGREAPHAGEPLTAERIEQLWERHIRARREFCDSREEPERCMDGRVGCKGQTAEAGCFGAEEGFGELDGRAAVVYGEG